MVGYALRPCAAIAAAILVILSIETAPSHAGDGPNQSTPSDVAAGRWFDSLLDRDLPSARRPAPPRRRRPIASRRAGLRARLVDNPDTRDGSPRFALVDRYGGVLRYIEPVDAVDLDPHLGQMVTVRHDTGDILLASQLDLSRTAGDHQLRLAQHEEPISAGEVIDQPSIVVDRDGFVSEDNGPIYLDEGIDFGECSDCGSYACGRVGGCGRRGRRGRGRPYVRAEYLLWWFDGMDTPPLVTTSNPADGGVLPNPGQNDNQSTRILYGGDPILEDARSGGRVTMGVWIDSQGRQAIEGDYFGFASESETFSIFGADGNPTISRPFFDFFPVNSAIPQENAEQVSSDTLDGRVTVRSTSKFDSFGIRLRHNLFNVGGGCGDAIECGGGVGCGSVVGHSGWGRRRVDLLTGFRYARLDETLRIREDLVVDAADTTNPPAGLPPDGTTILVRDNFETENEFIGGEVGFLWEIERRRWSLEVLSKLAIGNNRQRVSIRGDTTNTEPGQTPVQDTGGLLAGTTNIGDYKRDEFSIMPEIGMTLGYRLTPRLRLTAGYTLLYWTNVLRPGDQIDRQVNSTLLPGVAAGNVQPIPASPMFTFQNTNIWAQGLSFGGDYRW